MASFSGYQKRGIYPSAHPRIVNAITEISRAAGLPGINMYCYQPRGVGRHKTGEACDFQAGSRSRYAHSVAAHESIARYVLQPSVWKRLKIRYVAWNGWEYINTPGNARRQPRNYGGTDPWHRNHIHVDFKPGSIPGAIPNIPIGGGTTPPPSSTSKYYYPSAYKLDGVPGSATYTALQRFLADRKYYSGTPNGQSDSKMWTAYQKFLIYMNHYPSSTPLGYQDKSSARGTQQWQKRSGYYKHNITANWDKNTWKALQTYLRYAHSGTKVYPYQPPTPSNPKPTPPPPEPKPPVKAPTPQEGFLMALTNTQQKKVAEDVNKIKMATGRSEGRERDMLTSLQQQNDLLLSILDAVNNLNPGN